MHPTALRDLSGLRYDSQMPEFKFTTSLVAFAIIVAVGALTYPVVLRSATAPMTAPQVISMLDQTVDWFRTLSIQQQTATEPSDLLILYDIRQTASQAVRLAFDIARANAEILGNQPTVAAAGNSAAPSQTLSQHQRDLDAHKQAAQAELQSAQAALSRAPQNKRGDLQTKISALQGELDLIGARKNLLNTMSAFANDADGSRPTAL